MVTRQLEMHDVRDAEVLRVMRETPRHRFVPAEVRRQSYGDHALSIGCGATISQPYVVGLMTQLLQPAREHRVLEIGTGSGYQAAILSQLASHVYTVEIVPELARRARATLEELGYHNVTVREGDGRVGWPEYAPFDRILLTAAPVEIPAGLLSQLACNGRLVAPVGTLPRQDLVLVEKASDGTVRSRPVSSVVFLPMRTI